MPRLSLNDRYRALGQLDAGRTFRQVAATFGTSVRTITNLRNRVRQTATAADRPRSGRPRVTTRRQDRVICLAHLRDRFLPATSTAAVTPGRNNPRISAPTVRRRLREANLNSRRPYVGAVLTPRHRRQRLAWARQHLCWTRHQWHQVLFTDESRFQLDVSDGRIRVWRRRNERYADVCVRQRDPWGGPSVMVWGGICHGGITLLVVLDIQAGPGNGVTAQRYVDQVLRPVTVPFLAAHPGMTLMQDNARAHTARLTTQFLQQNNVNVLPWPAMSPDMNPIEHVWDQMGYALARLNVRPRNVVELRQAVLQAWQNIPQFRIRRLIDSLRRRCTACINAEGGHT